MALSLKERFSDAWFDIRYWNYDLGKDLYNLTLDEVYEKYYPLKDNSNFAKRLSNSGLLHQYVTDPKKACLLIKLGCSFIDLDDEGKTPIQVEIDNETLINSLYVISNHFTNKKIKLSIFEEDIDLIRKKNPGDDEIICYLRGFFYLMNEGSIHAAILWMEKFYHGNVSFNVSTYLVDDKDFMSLAVEHQDEKAIAYLEQKGIKRTFGTPTKKLPEIRNVDKPVDIRRQVLKKPQVIAPKVPTSLADIVMNRSKDALDVEKLNTCFMGRGEHQQFKEIVDALTASYNAGKKIYIPDRKFLPQDVTGGMLLKLVTHYLLNNDYDHQTLKVLWRFIVRPIAKLFSDDDEKLVTYCFKDLNISLSLANAEKDNTSATTSTVLKKAEHLKTLYQSDSMLSVNTGIYGGFGHSTLNAKLSEIILCAQKVDQQNPQEMNKLANLIEDFQQMKDQRTKTYKANIYVDSVKNKLNLTPV